MSERRVYTLDEIREWRKKQYDLGEPSGLKDFFREHDTCISCRGSGWEIEWDGNSNTVRHYKPCFRCGGTGTWMASQYIQQMANDTLTTD